MPAPICLVHNDRTMRAPMLAALRAAGYEVAAFEDPLRAFEAVEAGGRVRVLVTRIDFGSGKLNGIALARMVKLKRLPIGTVFVARRQFQEVAEGLGEF